MAELPRNCISVIRYKFERILVEHNQKHPECYLSSKEISTLENVVARLLRSAKVSSIKKSSKG